MLNNEHTKLENLSDLAKENGKDLTEEELIEGSENLRLLTRIAQ